MNGLQRLRQDLSREGLDLVRAWPRSAEHLLLHVRAGAGSEQDWVAGQWFADGARAVAVSRSTPGACHLPGAGVVLQPAGADRRLVVLADLLREPGAQLLAHRPERRAVVRRRCPAATGTTTTGTTATGTGAAVFTKVVPPSRLDGLLSSATWQPDGVRVPTVVALDRAAGTVTTAGLPGRTLHATGGTDPAVEQAWRCAGEAVAALHRAVPPPGAAPHGVADEVAVTRSWLDRAQQHGALDPGRLDRCRAAVERALAGLVAEPCRSVAVHRDLHDKQVLVDGSDAALLDLDLVAVGEPGLDVANLLVHLVLRDAQAALLSGGEGIQAAECRARAFLTGYGDVPDPARVRRLAVLAAVRVAAVYAFREPVRPGAPAVARRSTGVPDGGGTAVGDRLLGAVLRGLPGL